MKNLFLFVLMFFISINEDYAQATNLSSQIIDSVFSDIKKEKVTNRKMIMVHKKNQFNPMVYFLGGLLYVYQNIVSEQIQASCQYHVSCSEYMKKIIQKKGLLLGILKGSNQLINCSPSVLNDYPKCMHTKQRKIDNSNIE